MAGVGRNCSPRGLSARQWTACFAAAALLHFALALVPVSFRPPGAIPAPRAIELMWEPAASAGDAGPLPDPAAEPSRSAEANEAPADAPGDKRKEDRQIETRHPDPLIMPSPSDIPRLAYQGPRPEERDENAKYLSDSNAKARDRAPEGLPKGETFVEGDDPRVLFLDRRGGAAKEGTRPEPAAPGPSGAASADRAAEGEQTGEGRPGTEKAGVADTGREAGGAAAGEKASGTAEAPRVAEEGRESASRPVAGAGGGEYIAVLEELRRKLEAIPLRPSASPKDAPEATAGMNRLFDRAASDIPAAGARGRTGAEGDAAEDGGRVVRSDAGLKGKSNGPDAAEGRRRDGLDEESGREKETERGEKTGGEDRSGAGGEKPGADSVSDAITRQVSTSSGERGDPTLATVADPAARYLRGLITRIDRNWKGLIYTEKLRMRSGQVTFRYVIGADGRLLEIRETGRVAGVTNEAAALCRKAIEASFPFEGFPPDLHAPRLTVVLTFLYE
ncbi:MAG: hypothetical protein N3A38_08940 [Planctomycetota bacterium]|nr:hypothetical protein [Planctomycetota bacterium]